MAKFQRGRPMPAKIAVLGKCLAAFTALTGLVYWVVSFQTEQAALPEPIHPEAAVMQSRNAGPGNRTNLVIAVVGDTSIHTRWLQGFPNASWDLACIYSGTDANFTCPECVHIERNSGAKWSLVYMFTQSAAWQDTYQHQYHILYVPDDDILQTSGTIDRAFRTHQRHDLLISQPVMCSWLESHSATWDIVKTPQTVLRYTNFVEIMVPLFSMSVFKDLVIPTTHFAETGWGMDWLWPFMLGYPFQQVAFIDDVCVIHPKASLQHPDKISMYKHGQSPGWEEYAQFTRWGYDEESVRNHKTPFKLQRTLGQMWQPWYEDMLQQAGLQVDPDYVPREREVRLAVNTSLYQQRLAQSQSAPTPQDQGRPPRANLVVVTGQPHWLPAQANASWDLVAVQGSQTPVSCPSCLFTFDSTAIGRFEQLRQLVQSKQWGSLQISKYQYVYMPEGDVYHAVDQIDRIFELMSEYELLLAHPTICSDLESSAHLMDLMKRQPHNVLRYTTAVDILAPAFDTSFFQDTVIATLDNAVYGHGLQWLWPFLLGFDHHRTAVLDSVCIVHPKDELQNSLQTALRKPGPLKPHQPSWPWFPRWQWHRAPDAQQDFQGQDWDTLHFQPLRAPGGQLVEDETEAQLSKFGYKPELYGVKRKTAEMLEYVFQPWYQELLDMGNLQIMTFQTLEHEMVRRTDVGLSATVSQAFTDLSFVQRSKGLHELLVRT